MRRSAAGAVAVAVFFAVPGAFAAETLHFLVMAPTAAEREAPKYEALGAYLRAANPLLGDVKLRIARSYPEAARLFAEGDVEGMFSASYVAAVLVAKGVARPVARPIGPDGTSTYTTTIVARAGTPPFAGRGDLVGKRVAFCRLASAGEGFLRALLEGAPPESALVPHPVDSHQAALEAVASGAADYAVVKSTVFAAAAWPGLAAVGADAAAHPDNTLVMSREAHEKVGALVARALLALAADPGERAAAVRAAFPCTGFAATSGMDFAATFALLRRAGVDPKAFDFSFGSPPAGGLP